MPPASSSKRFPFIISLVVACALFMEFLDGTILSTALPAIAQSLNANPAHLSLAITSYLVSVAVFIPLCGWFADRFGTRVVFQSAVTLFSLASIGCGLSSTLGELVFWRILQGMGGAMMSPVGRLALVRAVPKRKLVDAWMWASVPALIAPLIGPFLGGVIVTYLSWHWIFFINAPIGIVGFVLAGLFMENTYGRKKKKLDIHGFLLMALTMGGFVFGLELIVHPQIHLIFPTMLLAGSVVCFFLYPIHAKKTPHRLLDHRLFRLPSFFVGTIGSLPFRIGAGAMPFLLPLLLQVGLGYSPIAAGAIAASVGLSSLCAKFLISPFLARYGYRTGLMICTVFSAINLGSYASFNESMAAYVIFAILLIGGLVRSVEYTLLNTIAFSELQPSKISAGTTSSSMFMQLAQSIGVCVGSIALNFTIAAQDQPYPTADSFIPPFLLCGVLTLATLLFVQRLPADTGSEVSGHVPEEPM